MFPSKHYVPAIRWRQGEYGALEELRSGHKEIITPLVDIPSIPWDFTEERASKTIDRHIQDVPQQMARAWGTTAPIFVDMGLVDDTERMANGRHPLDDLFDRLSAANVQAIPVTAPDRDAAYQTAVQAVMARDGRGVCIRASVDDLADASSIQGIATTVGELGASLSNVDLILDLRAIQASQTSMLRVFLANIIPQISNISDYRTLTLLTGAFPVNLSAISAGTAMVPRSDWMLWLSLRSATLPRYPSYGDYTASFPDQEEVDPRIMQASASIRYASDTDWVIVKGRSVKSPRYGGFGQFNTLSQTLMAHPLFTGASFSWASDFITQCASGGSTGNLTSWRKVATNRHMARAAHQISNLP